MPSTINADNGVVSGSSGVKTTADTSGVLALQSNGSTGLTLDTSLNVGIGTSSPSTPLHIFSSAQEQLRLGRSSTASSAYLTFYANNSSSAQVQYAGILGDVIASTAGSQSGALIFFTTNTGTSAERMRLDSSGNLGIGTSSPSQKLDATVSSSTEGSGLAVTNSLTGGYGSGATFYSLRSDTSAKVAAGAVGMEGASSWNSNATTSSSMVFKTINANTLAERFRIGPSGQLGIGGATYGSSGQVLTSGGSGAAPSWATPSAGALVYISQVVASSSATVSFTGLTAYDNYLVEFSKIAPSSTDDVTNHFIMYTSTNNGSSYATTSYNYAMSFVITSSSSVGVKASEADGNTYIRLSAGTFSSSESNCAISGDITLNLKNSTKYFFLAWGTTAQLNASGRTVNGCFSAGRPESSATNAIRFQFTVGNITSGTFRLYGIVNS